MSVYRCAADQFYEDMMAEKEYINAIWGEAEDIRETRFFEFCKHFSDISLNAPKYRIAGTCNIQGCFLNKDINIAKQETKKYIEAWKIQDVQTFLDFVYKMHSTAVEWNDKRNTGGRVLPENYDWKPGFAGMYYDFQSIPKEIWDQISDEILEYVSK